MVDPKQQLHVIGKPLPRVEDKRHLAGQSRFVADVAHHDCVEVAFLRSGIAFGALRDVHIPDEIDPESVWTADRLSAYAVDILARLHRPQFQESPWPLLARKRVRFVGEAIAAVCASSREEAEDNVALLRPVIDEFSAITDCWGELDVPQRPIHECLDSNVVMRTSRDIGDMSVFENTELRTLTRRFSMARVQASPLEGRGCYCYIDKSTGELVVYASHQRPHLLRTFLAQHIKGVLEADIRVIVPDVGGGFGGKSNLYPEEIIVAALTVATGKPHRWIEDRYEHLVASNHARQHEHEITAYFDGTGRIHGIKGLFVVDSGAYSASTSTGAIEANMAANVMLGPYDINNYKYEAIGVFTNKSPVGPFRGVGRPAACFAMERIIDEIAHELSLDPLEVRERNLVRQDMFPYTTATGLYYDSGNYEKAIKLAREHAASSVFSRSTDTRRELAEASQRYRDGVGYAMYVEQAAHGSVEWHRRGSPLVYGHESARATVTPDGVLVIDVGTLSHGQGHFTSMAQIASEETGVPVDSIRIRQGDTSRSAYGMGSVASRSIVMAGGAVAVTCRALMDKVTSIAAVLVQCEQSELTREGSTFIAPSGMRTDFAEVARVALVELHRLPKTIDPGISVERAYRPEVETGTFSYGLHIANVRVDTYTGIVNVTRYTVVEDCGTVINPLIVDGQVRGGVAQGIGQALFEEMRYSDTGQPETVTFADYRIPSSVEIPPIEIVHMNTPSPFSEFGMKGMGEGGAVGPPAAIANGVRHALRDLNIPVNETPIRPEDLLAQILRAKKGNEVNA